MKKVFIGVIVFCVAHANAQLERAITTAVPFLTVASDARAAGMGDIGVATTFDVYAQQWLADYYYRQSIFWFYVQYVLFPYSFLQDW